MKTLQPKVKWAVAQLMHTEKHKNNNTQPGRGNSVSLLRLPAIAIALTVLSSCTIGPNYTRPALVVPASYKEMAGWKVAQPKEAAVKGAWWEAFSDPRLNELEKQVNISNQNVIAAEAQYRQARALVQSSIAGYLPTVGAGASFTRSRQSSGAVRGLAPSGAFSDYSLPVTVSWEVDIWGRIRRQVEASKADAMASAADLEAVRLLSEAELAQDYFQLRILDAQKMVLDETILFFQKSLELTRSRS